VQESTIASVNPGAWRRVFAGCISGIRRNHRGELGPTGRVVGNH
jgi:hypothetical protein